MNPLVTGNCPTRDDWRLFLLGRVEPARVEAFEAHLVSCSVCLNEVSTLETADESVRAPRRLVVVDRAGRIAVDLYRGLVGAGWDFPKVESWLRENSV